MTPPLVTVIIPTTHDRRHFNELIFNNFIRQDYPNKQIEWDYEDGKVGEKRNRLCDRAQGEIIVHMDSDDMYADDWISRSVQGLIDSKCHIAGLNAASFWDIDKRVAWRYTYPVEKAPYVLGATMCYWKSFWKDNPFPVMQVGEDEGFVKRTKHVHYLHYLSGFLALTHKGNTSCRATHNIRWKMLGIEEENELIHRWKL